MERGGQPKGGADRQRSIFTTALDSLTNVGVTSRTPPRDVRAARAVGIAIVALTLVAIPYTVQYWRIGLPVMAAAVSATACFSLTLLVFLRRTGRASLAGGLALTMFVLLLLSNITSGGFYNPNFAWFYVIPIAAATFAGPRQAWLWTVVVLINTVVFWVLDEQGVGLVSAVPESERSVQALFNRVGAVLGIGVILALFVRWQRAAERGIRDAHAQLRLQESEMRRLALFDPLTGLPSRVFLERKIAFLSDHEEPFAMIFADIDRFKAINDTLGHPAGDSLLSDVGRRFESVVGTTSHPSFPDLDRLWAGPQAIVARRGGDEMIVVLPGATTEDAREVARRLADSVTQPFMVGARKIYVSVSMGIAVAPKHGEDAATLMRAADVALYEAKKRVGSSFAVYERKMTQSTPRTLLIEEALRQALEADGLRLAFQPLFDAHLQPRSAEALLRWYCEPLQEEMNPNDFISVAETTGLIVPMGRWVLNKACEEACTWVTPLRVAVNISVVQLRQPNFIDHVREALERSGLDPGRLELEITEGILVDDDEEVRNRLDDLRALGVVLTVDDFGTGYSNFAYLRRLPISRLKIDRAFVSRMHRDPGDAAVVRAVVAVGNALQLDVVAEGVESQEHIQMLKAMGCDELQGYHLERPLESEPFKLFLRPQSGLLRRNEG